LSVPSSPPHIGNNGRSAISVGPAGEHRTIKAAVAVSHPYDVIEIASGVYHDDSCIIEHPLTLIGTGSPLLLATDLLDNGKAILITRADVSMQGLTFRGAASFLGNGAGIRHEAGALGLTNCVFRRNQNGILAALNPAATVHLTGCRFVANGAGDGHTHGIYAADEIAALVIEDSMFVGTIMGHHIKSRARHSTIRRNIIGDGITGSSSYDVEFPNGGVACVQGNRVVHGMTAHNRSSICYGAEGLQYTENHLEVSDNVLVNERSGLSIGILSHARGTPWRFVNNTFQGFSIRHLAWPAILRCPF
jgi:hypothetical protein